MNESNKENCIEFLTGDKRATISLTSRKYISKIKKLQEANPELVDYIENKDGSICAHVPVNYIKISAPKQVSEEQREAASRRLKEYRAKNKSDELDEEEITEADSD